MYSRIAGTGSYLPEKILTNADLEKLVDTSDEWIRAARGSSAGTSPPRAKPRRTWRSMRPGAPWPPRMCPPRTST